MLVNSFQDLSVNNKNDVKLLAKGCKTLTMLLSLIRIVLIIMSFIININGSKVKSAKAQSALFILFYVYKKLPFRNIHSYCVPV